MLAQTALFQLHQLRETTVRACPHVATNDSPALHVIRGGDGTWVFLCGAEDECNHHAGQPLLLKELVKADPSLNAVAALEPHDFAERQAPDQPWEQGDQLAKEIPGCIEEHGWFIALVGDESRRIPRYFAYTIGMPTTQDHPELIMLGKPPEAMARTLNGIGDKIAKGQALGANETYRCDVMNVECIAKPVHPTWYRDYLGYGLWYHGGEDFEILQVFWADQAGRFPWEPECDPQVSEHQPDLTVPKQ